MKLHNNDSSNFGDYFLRDIIDYLISHYDAEELFGADYMEEWAKEWAEDNGYILEES